MTAGSLLRAVTLSLRRDKSGAAFSAFGVAVGVGALVFFVALGSGVGHVVREKVFPLDASLVEVVPPTVSFGSILGGGSLGEATVERLSQLPEVAAAYRRMQVRVPAVSRYEGDFFGARLRLGVEILAVGVDHGLVKGDVQLGSFTDPPPGEPIPAVIASRLLEIYNKSFAPARKLPQLSGPMVVGFTFPLELNRSYVAQIAAGPSVASQAQVVGVSARAPLAGLTIPLETARRLNRAGGADAETYTGVALQAKDPSRVPALVAEVKRMGLQIDDQERRLAESTGAAVAVTTSALALLSFLICALAAVNIAHALFASVRARAKELGILRAVGASRGDVGRLILWEATVLGAAGGAAGTAVAVGLGAVADAVAARVLPPFPYQPETFFQFSPALLVGGVALGILAALAGAYVPSRRAGALDPAQVLAG